jgi:hypothetical protein
VLLDEWEFGKGVNGRAGIVARLSANTYLKLLICNLILSPTLESQEFPFLGGGGEYNRHVVIRTKYSRTPPRVES